jgi:hypothetical protein
MPEVALAVKAPAARSMTARPLIHAAAAVFHTAGEEKV